MRKLRIPSLTTQPLTPFGSVRAGRQDTGVAPRLAGSWRAEPNPCLPANRAEALQVFQSRRVAWFDSSCSLGAPGGQSPEPPLTFTTSVAWPGEFESQTGLARHESSPSVRLGRPLRSSARAYRRCPADQLRITSIASQRMPSAGVTPIRKRPSVETSYSARIPRIHGCYERDRRLKQEGSACSYQGTWLSDWPRRPSGDSVDSFSPERRFSDPGAAGDRRTWYPAPRRLPANLSLKATNLSSGDSSRLRYSPLGPTTVSGFPTRSNQPSDASGTAPPAT